MNLNSLTFFNFFIVPAKSWMWFEVHLVLSKNVIKIVYKSKWFYWCSDAKTWVLSTTVKIATRQKILHHSARTQLYVKLYMENIKFTVVNVQWLDIFRRLILLEENFPRDLIHHLRLFNHRKTDLEDSQTLLKFYEPMNHLAIFYGELIRHLDFNGADISFLLHEIQRLEHLFIGVSPEQKIHSDGYEFLRFLIFDRVLNILEFFTLLTLPKQFLSSF